MFNVVNCAFKHLLLCADCYRIFLKISIFHVEKKFHDIFPLCVHDFITLTFSENGIKSTIR